MRSTLWPLLALFLLLHLLYNWAIPLGEGPDEPGHLAYTLFLASEGRLPVQREAPAASDVPGEGHQPPLAYALAVPAVAWLPEDERAILLTANPRFVWAGGDEPGAFMRGSNELWPWQGLTTAWHLVRAVSGLWGAAAVAFTFLAARRLAPAEPWLAPLAAALVAFNPQLLFTTALATNDALLAALGAAMLWWCLRPHQSPLAWGAVAGALFGLALLTKQSALLLGPLILWGGWRAAGGRPRELVIATASWGGAAVVLAGWWFWRNLALYGDLFGLGAFKAEFITQPFAWGDPAAWVGAVGQLFGSYWARFGWMSVAPPAWTLWLYGLVCALGVAGWVGGPHIRDQRAWIGPLIAVAMACAWVLAFAATAGLVAWQGRMLFPAVGALSLLLAAGLLGGAELLRHRAGSRRNQGERGLFGAPAALCLGLLVVATLMPMGVIRPAYSWVALAPPVAQAGLGNNSYARFAASWEQGVVLRGWRLDGPVLPGAELPVTLTWNSLEPVPRPWTVFVHLVADDETIVAQSNRQPRADSLPFPLWTAGDWIADTHTLALPGDLAPGAYQLRVGLFRADKDGRRQEVWAQDGSDLGSYAELGTLVVE